MMKVMLIVCSMSMVGCGTVRGMIDGFESISVGLAQDMRGMTDGVAEADSEVQ
jgi:biopolymer transport protein ExbB/TolQ